MQNLRNLHHDCEIEPRGDHVSVLALALFGSRARGDHHLGSDTDILVVTDEDEVRVTTMASVSLSIYPASELINRARSGDLFTGHLVVDAKPLHDPNHFLVDLRRSWIPRSSYAPEILHASNLALFLLQHHHILQAPSLVCRRIAWCVRTILIARSADAGMPRYSAHDLAAFSDDCQVYSLLALKDRQALQLTSLQDLNTFVHRWGVADLPHDQSFGGFVEHFTRTRNSLALKTVGARAEQRHNDYE